jgi:hypothetical protein
MEALELASTELANQQQYARDLVAARVGLLETSL